MKNNVLLVLTALIWGCAFVAQSVGMDYVGPFTFNMARFLIGAIVLLPVIWFMDRQRKTGQKLFCYRLVRLIGSTEIALGDEIDYIAAKLDDDRVVQPQLFPLRLAVLHGRAGS